MGTFVPDKDSSIILCGQIMSTHDNSTLCVNDKASKFDFYYRQNDGYFGLGRPQNKRRFCVQTDLDSIQATCIVCLW